MLPTILTCLLIRFHFGATLLDFVPFINDEVEYWHETLTFIQVGFNGGYYTREEYPAPAEFSHFGMRGPQFPILYGIPGHFLGWYLSSGPIYNLILITIALCLFIYLARLDNKQLLITGLFLSTFWPLLLLVPTNMQEGMHYAIAIVLAGIFSVVLSKTWEISTVFRGFSLLFLIFVSLIKPSWSLLFIPFLIFTSKNKSYSQVFLSFVKATFSICLSFLIVRYIDAPTGSSFRSFAFTITNFTTGLTSGNNIELLMRHVRTNLISLLSFYPKDWLEILQRYQVLFLLAFLCSVAGFNLLKRRKRESSRLPERSEVLFHLLNLGTILVSVIVFYIVDSWGGLGPDYRLVSPHLLLTLLVFIALLKGPFQTVKSVLIGLIILSNIALSPAFISTYKQFRGYNFVYPTQGIASFHLATRDFLIYQENQNPWCNTLLLVPFAYHELYRHLLAVPAGIGISIVIDRNQLRFPLKSKYLLIDPDNFRVLRDKLNIQLLGPTPIGNLYLNLDSQCI
jgi:hypothetical protein